MKAAILFVDDDLNMLNGLQRMLRRQRTDWDMQFADGGRKALDMMAAATTQGQSFDMVVSDMRMPELDGASLLSEVERLYPSTIRVILSGYAEEKSLLRSVGPAHQYLSKPCEADTIITLMERTLRLQTILKSPDLRALASGLRTLPSPPDLFLRLTEAMNNPLSSSHQIAAIISEDVAMTAELLKITNSSYYSFTSHVATVEQAVRLLGLETVRTLVLHAGIFRQYAGTAAGSSRVLKLNQYGLAVGNLARHLAKADGASDGTVVQAECAATLSSIGMLMLLDQSPEKYLNLCAASTSATLEDAERAQFQAAHSELGAYLLGLWGFTDAVLEAVLMQVHPSACPENPQSPLNYVHIARAFGPAIPLLGPEPYNQRLTLDPAFAERPGMDKIINTAQSRQAEDTK